MVAMMGPGPGGSLGYDGYIFVGHLDVPAGYNHGQLQVTKWGCTSNQRGNHDAL